jgi:hypothetical protein
MEGNGYQLYMVERESGNISTRIERGAGVVMTKLQYKILMREYRVSFKSGTYGKFWDSVSSDQFDLVNSMVKNYHNRDYVKSNRLDLRRIWGV